MAATSATMTHPSDTDELSNAQLLQINSICNEFESAWKNGEPSIESFVDGVDDRQLIHVLQHYLIELDIECRSDRGISLEPGNYLARFPKVNSNWLKIVHSDHLQRPREESIVSVEIDDSGMNLTVQELLARLRSSQVVSDDIEQSIIGLDLETATVHEVGTALVDAKFLTEFQLNSIIRRPVDPLVLGDYVLLEQIGEGGMGSVYRAIHRRMNRIVALKVLKTDGVHASEFARRFAREIQVAAKLSHSNIAAAYDAGEQHGINYLVSEYIDGQNLSEVVRDNGPLSLPDALDVVGQVADGLAYAHQKGVIHRDIKPSNLLLDDEGNAKLLDVGLAKVSSTASHEDAETDLTQTGLIMGTVDYMAPEQAQNTRLADERSDIYSVGCTLHFLLTGRPPFHGETSIERLLAHREQPIPDLLELNECVPEQLQNLLESCMAKSPNNRLQSADELVKAIQRLQKDSVPEITLPVVAPGPYVKRKPSEQSGGDPQETLLLETPEPTSRVEDDRPTERLTRTTPDDLVEQDISRSSHRLKWLAIGTTAILVLGILAILPHDPIPNPRSEWPEIQSLESMTEDAANQYHSDWVKAVGSAEAEALDLDFVVIPPGDFRTDTKLLSVRTPFFMSTTEVTVGAYRKFIAETNHESLANDGGYGFNEAENRWEFGPEYGWNFLKDIPVTDSMPAAGINYYDAVAYCKWASETIGRLVRLPTETEWEYASRCGRTGSWSCGENDDNLAEFAWYVSNSGQRLYETGSRRPNAWGLFDMHGNECEWCLPKENEDADLAPLRGGSYGSRSYECTHGWRKLQSRQQIVHGAFRVIVEP